MWRVLFSFISIIKADLSILMRICERKWKFSGADSYITLFSICIILFMNLFLNFLEYLFCKSKLNWDFFSQLINFNQKI